MSWNKNGNYSPDDLMMMQKDAMERVRQMQRRADEKLRRSNQPSQHQQTRPSPSPSKPPPAQENNHQQTRQPAPTPHQHPNPPQNQGFFPPALLPNHLPTIQPGKITAALSALGVDHDRVILLAVLLILYNDGADTTLLLAILYLLL